MMIRFRTFVLLAVSILFTVAMVGQSGSLPSENWIVTWATSQEMAPAVQERPVIPPGTKMPDFSAMRGPRRPTQIPKDVADQTVRMIVHTSIAGKRLRLELSNSFGKSVVSIGSAHVAIRTSESSVDTASDRQLIFSGSPSVNIGPGVVIISDPFNLDVKAMSDLAVSLYVVKSEGTPTNHTPGLHTAYISKGDTSASSSMPEPTTTTSYLWLRSIDVVASANDFAVACLGDSITDGTASTLNGDDRWTDVLARRLFAVYGPRVSVINEGISGNMILWPSGRAAAKPFEGGPSALDRIDRDVLSLSGLSAVIWMEGLNDFERSTPEAVAKGIQEGVKRLRARGGIKIIAATLPSSWKSINGIHGTAAMNARRQAFNRFIRTAGIFDGVIDFDAVTLDKNTGALLQEFQPDSTFGGPGDLLHPNRAGYQAMGAAVDLRMFAPASAGASHNP